MFEHLKKYDIRDKDSWMDMPELGPQARLLLRPAGEANPPYYNALIRRIGKERRAARDVTVDDLRKHRDHDRQLYPLYVISSWENVLDSDGNSVPFDRELAKELCSVLPAQIFDRLRNYAAAPENFVPEDEELPPDPADIAGN